MWIVFTLACSTENKIYEGDEFTFSAPKGYETKLYEPPYKGVGYEGSNENSEELLFSNVGHYPFFVVYRQKIPTDSNLDTVFGNYKSETASRYQVLSQNTISMNNSTAIEYVHCEYLGEPFVKSREIWVEHNGWVYSLVCVHSHSGLPCADNPEPDKCVAIAEGFNFKE